MNDDANLWSEQALNTEALADLEHTLAAPLDSHLREQLRKAVDRFQFLAMADEYPALNPSRAQRRKELNALAKAAKSLAAAVAAPTMTYRGVRFEPALPGAKDLHAIASQAKSLADDIPRTGADPKQARLHLVASLGDIFEQATGQSPMRRVDRVTGREEGPFLEFCFKIAAHLEPFVHREALSLSMLSGIERDVRTVTERRLKRH